MNKNYYKELSRRYFEAGLSPREDRLLLEFLATTEDPEFNEVKAVAAFFAQGRSVHPAAVVSAPRRTWVPATIAAAAALAIVSVSVLIGTEQRHQSADSLASMENTLTTIFSSGADFESELSELLNQ